MIEYSRACVDPLARPAGTLTRGLFIDPALSVCGWSIIDLVQPKKGKPYLQVFRIGDVKSTAYASRAINRKDVAKFNKRIITLCVARRFIDEIIDEFKPDHVAIEGTYCHRFPQAFAALEQLVATIAIHCHDKYQKTLHIVPTKSAKQSITGSGAAKKEDVLEAVFKAKDIKVTDRKEVKKIINDHIADSIAVGHYFFNKIWTPFL